MTAKTTDGYDWTHLVVWSSSSADNSGDVFDVKAAIDMTAHDKDEKIMHCMQCTLYGNGSSQNLTRCFTANLAADQVASIAEHIPSISTLGNWTGLFQGYMYDGYGSAAIDDPESMLAWLLNTIIMVQGGSGTRRH